VLIIIIIRIKCSKFDVTRESGRGQRQKVYNLALCTIENPRQVARERERDKFADERKSMKVLLASTETNSKGIEKILILIYVGFLQ